MIFGVSGAKFVRPVAIAVAAVVSLSALPLASLADAAAVTFASESAVSQPRFGDANADFCTRPSVLSKKRSDFSDVEVGDRFFVEINWNYCVGISRGTLVRGEGRYFSPKQALTREAMAAFLFRMDAPKNYRAPVESPFADLSQGDKFYREIAWMGEAGISTGTRQPSGKPLFAPKQPLSREAMAAFLYRYQVLQGDADAVSFVVPPSVKFSDVTSHSKFYREIAWMEQERVSTGVKVGTQLEYRPKQNVSREAMAAFLYRLYKGEFGPKIL